MFRKILIANRGEIACRVIRTARRMGIATVAVYSDADAEALHVRMADEAIGIGPAPSAESYLRIDRIVEACRASGAEAVHPGYGFLSENVAFASSARRGRYRVCRTRTQSDRGDGRQDRIEKARPAAGVSTVPGYLDIVPDAEAAVAIARDIGYPVMIKASAGGGGKGMRIAASDERGPRRLPRRRERGQIELCRRPHLYREIYRGAAAHRDPGVGRRARQHCLSRRARMLDPAPPSESHRGSAEPVSRRLTPRGDGPPGGGAGPRRRLSLGRDGRVHRRSPAQFLFSRNEHTAAGRASGDRTGYRARPRRADAARRRRRKAAVRSTGHSGSTAGRSRRASMPRTRRAAFCRRPAVSSVICRRAGKGVRLDDGVYEGAEISVYYDPMIAKLSAYGADRDAALDRLRDALDGFYISGVQNNAAFLAAVAAKPRFRAGALSTNFIAEEFPGGFAPPADFVEPDRMILLAAALAGRRIREHRDRDRRQARRRAAKFPSNGRSCSTARRTRGFGAARRAAIMRSRSAGAADRQRPIGSRARCCCMYRDRGAYRDRADRAAAGCGVSSRAWRRHPPGASAVAARRRAFGADAARRRRRIPRGCCCRRCRVCCLRSRWPRVRRSRPARRSRSSRR